MPIEARWRIRVHEELHLRLRRCCTTARSCKTATLVHVRTSGLLRRSANEARAPNGAAHPLLPFSASTLLPEYGLVISVQHCAGEDGTGARFASRTRRGRHQNLKMMQLRAKLAESDFGVFSVFEALRRSESESRAELVADGAARLGSRAPARRARNSRGHIVFKFGLGDSDPRAAGRAGLAPRRAPAWRRPNLRFQSTRTSSPWLPTLNRRPASSSASQLLVRPAGCRAAAGPGRPAGISAAAQAAGPRRRRPGGPSPDLNRPRRNGPDAGPMAPPPGANFRSTQTYPRELF